MTHFVHVSRKREFTSPTLPPQAIERLERRFGAAGWWRDRWAWRGFRAEARNVLREHGGLVLLGPGMRFDVPPAFREMFEPIEIHGGLTQDSDRLKTLSGEEPTYEERFRWIAVVFGALAALALGVIVWIAKQRGGPPAPLYAFLVFGVVIVIAALCLVSRWSGRWFLIPGAIAIVRRPARRKRPARITVLSRADTVPVFRYVQAGKTTVLMLELLTHAGQRVKRAVSQREAVSILAAWQSPLTPPTDDQLEELLGG